MNCPNCGGIADNGHNREDPPAPYLCTKCEDAQPKITLTTEDWLFMLDCEYNQPISPPTPAMLKALQNYKQILGCTGKDAEPQHVNGLCGYEKD